MGDYFLAEEYIMVDNENFPPPLLHIQKSATKCLKNLCA